VGVSGSGVYGGRDAEGNPRFNLYALRRIGKELCSPLHFPFVDGERLSQFIARSFQEKSDCSL